MEETFELAVKLIADLVNENRAPTLEERALLVKVIGVALFDLHSVAGSLAKIATAVEGLDLTAAHGIGRDHRG